MQSTMSIMGFLFTVIAVVLFGQPATADDDVCMVGLRPTLPGSAIAVELDVASGTTVTAVRWLNNDQDSVFPLIEVREGAPADLSAAQTRVSEASVSGGSLEWSHL